MSNQANNIPLVDLVIVIDTSPSMKDEAQALSNAASAAIDAAKLNCPSDLRVTWFGIEGTWKGTNFDQTIRAYLTSKCKIVESNLRGRKRGELKSAGAQEDAARAIEDISNYFDWREGTARTIFYLGDEALEGGGYKTEQKDIEAANLAIQKAKGSGVTVHTYFGTSKSKHRQSIATEYARVASETGGQAFTDKDTIQGFSGVLEKVICGSRTVKTPKLKPGAVYISETIKEEGMTVLTIDTKNNCYVINPDQMNNLQQNVATSLTLEKGTFDIKIDSGRYSYAQSQTEGEPFVLLWIYGVDGSKFINKTTGYEIGATWTTLNGYNDNLQLEVKDKAVVCALFFDVNNAENSGSVNLLITSNKPSFTPQTLTVDSKKNCYVLDEKYLVSLKQWGQNFIELAPGNYRIKIRESNASYWSDNKKFDIEPWAVLWVKLGKFIPKVTGTEIEETWCSLNGLKDEFILQVKEKTTLSGLFFDAYKENNEGQIILAIEPVTLTPTPQPVVSGGSGSRETVSSSSSMNFSFQFNESEFKKKWEEQWQQINASMEVIDEKDAKLEAKYWDQLEHWLMKNYEKHFKSLSIDVAKLRFTMDAYIQQMEFSLNQHLQTWSGYLNQLIEDRINVEISQRINQQINQYIDQNFEQKIRNNVELIVNNIVNQQQLNQYIDQHVNQQVDQSFQQTLSNNINLITQNLINNNTELNQYVSQQIDNTYEQKIQNHIPVITEKIVNNNQELNQYIDQHLQQTVINNTEINEEIANFVANSTAINIKIENLRNEWSQTFITLIREHADELTNIIAAGETFNTVLTQNVTNNNTELNQYVSQQIDNTYEQKIQNHIQLITQKLINNNQELNQYFDHRLQQNITNNTTINNDIVNLVVNSTAISTKINNVYQDLDNKIENIRNEWNHTFISLVTQQVDQMINIIGGRQTFNSLIANIINVKVNELLNQIIRVKNELTVIMNNADRNLYEWTLGELMSIKGCLTDRQALADLLVSFSAELRTKLDCAPCVDIQTIKPFRPMDSNISQAGDISQIQGSTGFGG